MEIRAIYLLSICTLLLLLLFFTRIFMSFLTKHFEHIKKQRREDHVSQTINASQKLTSTYTAYTQVPKILIFQMGHVFFLLLNGYVNSMLEKRKETIFLFTFRILRFMMHLKEWERKKHWTQRTSKQLKWYAWFETPKSEKTLIERFRCWIR